MFYLISNYYKKNNRMLNYFNVTYYSKFKIISSGVNIRIQDYF